MSRILIRNHERMLETLTTRHGRSWRVHVKNGLFIVFMEKGSLIPKKEEEFTKYLTKFLAIVMGVLLLFTVLSGVHLYFTIQTYQNTRDYAEPKINNTNYEDHGKESSQENHEINNTWSFVVDQDAILPPTDQMNIGTCWSFAMIYLFESQYHQQGVKMGFLKKDEYVQFSKQAWFTWLYRQCHENHTKACNYGGFLNFNNSYDNEIDAVYYFVNAWKDQSFKAILPESVCPYYPRNETDPNHDYFKCPGLDKALEENPIQFAFVDHKNAYTINDIKKLLIQTNRALGFGVPLPNFRYNIPCIGSAFEQSEMCVKKQYRCPPRYNNANEEYCYRWDIDSRTLDGVFLSGADTAYTSELGGHCMNVVGFNDDWIYRNRYQTEAVTDLIKGGFILHNSWRSEGHSVEYLMGNQSEENEAVQCPNHRTALNWIPADLQCVKDNHGDVTKCSTDIQRIRGKGIAKGADLLNCTNKDICDVNKKYAVGRFGNDHYVQVLPDGSNIVQMIEIDPTTKEVKELMVTKVPFYTLRQAFVPEKIVENDPNNCGYWMFPYHTLEVMQRINWDLLDNFRVYDYQVVFTNSSYLKGQHIPGKDYSLINQSTKHIERIAFDGPLPYDYIY